MEIFSLVVNILFLIAIVWFSFRNPTLLACTYIIYQTSYFGLAFQEVIISGVDIGSFTVNIALLLPLLMGGRKIHRVFDKHSKYAILFFTFFFVYGILLPYVKGYQTLVMGVMAAKSFLAYTFFFYLIVFRKHINFDKVFKVILLCSYLFAFLYIINKLGIAIVPPAYEKDDYLQCHYDSFFPISIIYLFYLRRSNKKVSYFYLKVLYLLVGIYLGGFFSVLATTIAVILLLLLSLGKNRKSLIIGGVLALFVVGICYFSFNSKSWYQNVLMDQLSSLDTRDANNEFRLYFISQNLYWGGGFLYKSSSIIQSINISDSQYQETLSFIDSGYIDLLGRFGVIGMILFLLYPSVIMVKCFRYWKLIPFSLFIFQFLCVNYTWSVFSFPHGIILLAIVYSLIIKDIYDKDIKKTPNMVRC